MRMADRPIRPLWPDGFTNDVQVQAFVLSYDQENDPDILSLIGASAALSLSPLPFLGPLGRRAHRDEGRRVRRLPRPRTVRASPLDLVVAGTRDAVTMVEAGANELSEEVMLEAILFGHEVIQRICEAIEELRRKVRLDSGRASRQALPDPAAIEAVARARRATPLRTALHPPDEAGAQPRPGGRARAVKAALARRGAPGSPPPGGSAPADVSTRRSRGRAEICARPRSPARASTAAARTRSARSTIEVGRPPPRPRLGAVHPRRDAGARHRHARHRARREDRSTGSTPGRHPEVLPPLQLPAVLRRRDEAHPRPLAAARSATARSPSGRSSPVLPDGGRSPTRSASSPTS